MTHQMIVGIWPDGKTISLIGNWPNQEAMCDELTMEAQVAEWPNLVILTEITYFDPRQFH